MQSKETRLGGIFPALLTPLHENDTVNANSLEKLLERVCRAGVDGVYVCGSTGEGVSLPEPQRRKVAEIAVRNLAGKQVIVHVGSQSLDESVRLAEHAERTGAAAVSCIRPAGADYNEMLAWYRTLAGSTGLPFLAYYFPASAGGPLNIDQLSEICRIPGVRGVKFTDYDLYTLSLLAREGKLVFNGRDEVLAAGLLMGACGGIGSIYNLMPEWFVQLNRLALAGNWSEARASQDLINNLIRVLVRYPFPLVLKQVLTWEGIECGGVVGRKTVLSIDQQASLRAALEALGIFTFV